MNAMATGAPMTEVVSQRLDLRPQDLALLSALLKQHLPQTEVWAYGSRVNGDGHEASDLDLVVRQPEELMTKTTGLDELKDALVESDLPIRVDVIDWARIPESFRREIERGYVVIQDVVHGLSTR